MRCVHEWMTQQKKSVCRFFPLAAALWALSKYFKSFKGTNGETEKS